MDINESLELALDLQQKGELSQSENIYKEILKTQPDHFYALHYLGILYYQRREYDYAVEHIKKALLSKPTDPHAYYNLGNVYKDEGQFDEAANCFQKSLQLDPDNADAYNNQGIVHKEQGQFKEAIECFQKALQLNPDQVASNYNLGVIFKEQGQLEEAIHCFQKALKLQPDIFAIHYNLGLSYQKQGYLDSAISFYKRALQINPNFADAYYHCGIALYDKGEIDEAETYYRKVIQINPFYLDAYNNLGVVLQEKGQLDNAISNYQKALQINPRSAEAYNGLGTTMQEKGRLKEAILFAQKALDMKPDFADAHWNKALMLLLFGKFEEGWEQYEWRWQTKDHYQRHFSQPEWDGGTLEAKTIFVYAEQGIGDEIMFASCLPEVIEQTGLCIVECDRRLVPLFARSFPRARVIERIKEGDPYPSDLQISDTVIAIGSLPRYFRTNLKSFPNRQSFLIADSKQTDLWRKRYQELGKGLKVGISWLGGKKPRIHKQRSVGLEQLKDLFLIPDIHFINLQYGDFAADLEEAQGKLGVRIHDWADADPFRNLDNLASQIKALDLVFSVDNTTLHISCALGVPVWALIPFAPDWRWMLEREDSPWYPTIRLFRQPTIGDWESVIAKVSQELHKKIVKTKT